MPSAIRLAVYDREKAEETTFKDAGADVATILGHQANTPNPPRDNVQNIGLRFENPDFLCMIDDTGPVAGFQVVTKGDPESKIEEEQGPHVIVIWWYPRASWAEDNMPLLIPVFGKACAEVMRHYPGSEDWPIYGDYPGVGETPEERTASSLAMVTEWQVFWNQSPVGPFAELSLNPYNETQCRIIGTVGKVVQFAKWLAKERKWSRAR